jgi:hypothetical protein
VDTELTRLERQGRRAFALSLVWPGLFALSWLDIPVVGSFTIGYARLFSFTIGIACSIVAVSLARGVRRSDRSGLATAALVLGWVGVALSVMFILGALVLVYLFAHSDWQF